MALATSLVKAAQNLINTFGNDSTLYTFSTATKTDNDEGETTVSNWGTGTTVKVVDENNVESLSRVNQGMEKIAEDEKIIRDDVVVALNDRLTYDGKEFRIMGIQKERVESTDIIQIIKVSEVTDTSQW